MLDGRLRHFFSGQHSRNLRDALRPGQFPHGGDRSPQPFALLRAEMAGSQRRDLRHVCDAEHLVVPRKQAQLPADDFRSSPADSGVHLVEDERAPSPRLTRRDGADRELQPRELASRSNPLERFLGLAGIGREEQGRRLEAVRPRGFLDRSERHP